jgi:hypothetical protein
MAIFISSIAGPSFYTKFALILGCISIISAHEELGLRPVAVAVLLRRVPCRSMALVRVFLPAASGAAMRRASADLFVGMLLRHAFRRIAYVRIATGVRLVLTVSWHLDVGFSHRAAHLVLRSLIGKREIILIRVLFITFRTNAPIRQTPGRQPVYTSDCP